MASRWKSGKKKLLNAFYITSTASKSTAFSLVSSRLEKVVDERLQGEVRDFMKSWRLFSKSWRALHWFFEDCKRRRRITQKVKIAEMISVKSESLESDSTQSVCDWKLTMPSIEVKRGLRSVSTVIKRMISIRSSNAFQAVGSLFTATRFSTVRPQWQLTSQQLVSSQQLEKKLLHWDAPRWVGGRRTVWL